MPGEIKDNEHQIMSPEATAQFLGLPQVSCTRNNTDYLVSVVLFSSYRH